MIPIELGRTSSAELALWRATSELATALPESSWTLIGAQMVFLLAYEYGLPVGRTSGDIDMMVDVRAVTRATEFASTTLERLGYVLDPPSPDGLAHRFRRHDALVDVLAPDGAGRRVSMTTIPPGRTLAVAGGSQALRRSRRVPVALDGRIIELPCPSLLGAILIKARAVEVAQDPDKHRRDLGLLLAGVEDPRILRRELSESERAWLRRRRELLEPGHAIWRTTPHAADARAALEILADRSEPG